MKARTILFASFLVMSLFSIPLAWGQTDHTKALIEGAKKEGKVVWYTALSIQDAELLIKRFEQTGGKHHANMFETRFAFHVAAQLEAGFPGEKNIRQD